MTREEKRAILAQMARDPNLSVKERQAAIDLDNKMEKEYTARGDSGKPTAKLEDII